jgi:NADH:ubiquinone oxidoreductase subunit 3 (subunit A)
MVLQIQQFVDKYLLVIMIFLIVSIPISLIDPGTGGIREQPRFELFYISIAGICVIVLYSSYKERKARQKANAKRRSRK